MRAAHPYGRARHATAREWVGGRFQDRAPTGAGASRDPLGRQPGEAQPRPLGLLPGLACGTRRAAPGGAPAGYACRRPTAPAVVLLLVALGTLLRGEAPLARADEPRPAPGPAPELPKECVRLSPEADVWIDRAGKQVVLEGRVVLRAGPLELLACPEQTKEHEAIVALKTKAFVVHTALLAVGAEVGAAVQYDPEYRPASGTPIDVEVRWVDSQGKTQSLPAQQWIRDVKTGQAMATSWVFAGSGFWENPDTRERYYLAEDGDLICVSNFPSATLDVPIESSQANEALLFEAFTDRIPPLDTRVQLRLKPRPATKTRKE